MASVGAAALLAVTVMAHGGYAAVGATSIAVCVLGALAGLALPEGAGNHAVEGGGEGERSGAGQTGAGYAATSRAGLREARTSRPVRNALVLLIVATAFWGSLEEYIPLPASAGGVPTNSVPAVLLVVWALVTLGGLTAGRAVLWPRPVPALALPAATLAVGVGVHLGTWGGWVLLGAGFAVCQLLAVVADARLQERVTGPARATVTSLAGLGTEAVAIAVFTAYAGLSTGLEHPALFALFSPPYAVAGLVLLGPPRRPRPGRARPRRG